MTPAAPVVHENRLTTLGGVLAEAQRRADARGRTQTMYWREGDNRVELTGSLDGPASMYAAWLDAGTVCSLDVEPLARTPTTAGGVVH